MKKKEEEVKRTPEQEAELLSSVSRPLAGQASKPIDPETASHQYQPGSPAVDTNVLSDHPNRDLNSNILDKIETKENLEAKEKAAELAAESYQSNLADYDGDCSKLDVSDVRYCQPGSERHKSWKKKNKE